LAVTDDAAASPNSVVDRVAYLAFFSIEEGGVVLVGDKVEVAGKEVGEIAGFDVTHAPNHMNVLLRVEQCQTGPELGLHLGEPIIFRSTL